MKRSTPRENTICFRTSNELRKKIEQLANAERRSLSQWVEMRLEEAVETGLKAVKTVEE